MGSVRINAEDLKSIGLAVAAGVVLYVVVVGPEEAGKKAAGFVGDVFGGFVRGAASLFGVPDPETEESKTKCCDAMRSYGRAPLGSAIKASAYCSAGDFAAWWSSSARPQGCPGGASGEW